ncbi:BGTF surface domain-containing protein [Halorussus salinus]|uniref:BGTF surface domain-containing protein n=1 Tax=Halorussus salinus TaxID=1364935 RepID=UPI0010925246|nr:BGTF surface domain-containing protein [Halorussus salinus]
MSANSPSRVVALVAVLLVASVVPALATSGTGNATAASVSFTPSVVYEERGDVANITVQTNGGGYLNIGSPSDAFWLRIKVGGGKKKVRLDTYRAGMAKSREEMEKAISGGTLIEFGLSDLNKPLGAAKYTMNVTRNGNELGIGALVLEERGTFGVSTRIAPDGVGAKEVSSKQGMEKHGVAPGGKVAYDDWLLVHINATGVKGALDAAILSENDDVMQVNFVQTSTQPNADPNRFYGAEASRVFTVGDREGFYLAVDTSSHGIEPGDAYRVEFVVPKESPLTKKRENVSANIKVVDRQVDLNRNGPGEKIVVDGKTTIRGSTSLTPGSTINISARDDDIPPFHMGRTVTVTNERTFETTFDFSDIEPGREFDIRLADQKRTVPGIVAIEATPTATTAAPDPTTTATPDPTTTETATRTTAPPDTATQTTKTTAAGLTQAPVDATSKPLTQRAVENASDADGASDGGGGGGLVPVPGFGPLVGLVALLAGGLVAARRR